MNSDITDAVGDVILNNRLKQKVRWRKKIIVLILAILVALFFGLSLFVKVASALNL